MKKIIRVFYIIIKINNGWTSRLFKNSATDFYSTNKISNSSLYCKKLILSLIAISLSFCTFAKQQPNIIIVVADDLSRTLCTFLPEGKGKTLMPHLDRLSEEGTVLNMLHSPAPVCTPSRFAILTGNFPSRCSTRGFHNDAKKNGQTVVGFNTHLDPEEDNLAKRFQAAGYSTGAVGKNHVLAVEEYRRLPHKTLLEAPGVKNQLVENEMALKKAFQKAGFKYAERLYFGNPDADGINPLAMHNQEWITEGALNFIEKNRETPFFLYIATTIPHGPFNPERSWRNKKYVTPVGIKDDIPKVQAPRNTIDQRLEDAEINAWNTGQVLWLDDAIGALFKKLQELDLDKNTIILFTSDHGTEAKGGLYQKGTLTGAFIWKKDGFKVGHKTMAQLQLTDFTPTLLDLAGIPYESRDFDGKSFKPVLENTTTGIHDILYFEMGYSRAIIKDEFKYLALRYPAFVKNMSLQEREQRLNNFNESMRVRGRPILTEDPTKPFSHLFLIPGGHDADQTAVTSYPFFFDADQLYNLKKDPQEQKNLAYDPAYSEKLKDLKMALNKKIGNLPGGFGEFGSISQNHPKKKK